MPCFKSETKVRYPSDESSKFPHFPAVEDQLDFGNLGKIDNNIKVDKKVNVRPVRQKPANSYRDDNQSQPSSYESNYENYFTTIPTTATTTIATPLNEKNTRTRGRNYNGKSLS